MYWHRQTSSRTTGSEDSTGKCGKEQDRQICELQALQEQRFGEVSDVCRCEISERRDCPGQVDWEFSNREAAVRFCKKNKVLYTDISNQLQTRIKNKKIQANQKSTAPERSNTQERTKN